MDILRDDAVVEQLNVVAAEYSGLWVARFTGNNITRSDVYVGVINIDGIELIASLVSVLVRFEQSLKADVDGGFCCSYDIHVSMTIDFMAYGFVAIYVDELPFLDQDFTSTVGRGSGRDIGKT